MSLCYKAFVWKTFFRTTFPQQPQGWSGSQALRPQGKAAATSESAVLPRRLGLVREPGGDERNEAWIGVSNLAQQISVSVRCVSSLVWIRNSPHPCYCQCCLLDGSHTQHPVRPARCWDISHGQQRKGFLPGLPLWRTLF